MNNYAPISAYEQKAVEENLYQELSEAFDVEFGEKLFLDFSENFSGNYDPSDVACGFIYQRYKNGDAKTREVIDKTLIDLCGMPLVRLCRENVGTEGKFY